MKTLILLAHQRPESFCHAIAEAAAEELTRLGHEFCLRDLYADKFDPVLPDEEIPKGSPAAPQVQEHVDELMSSEGVIVVHPNWWAGPPAILKGWLDRCLRPGVAYDFMAGGIQGHLGDKRVLVFSTSNTPREIELKVYGDPLENFWKTCVWRFCGVKEENYLRRNFESIVMSTPEERAEWLEATRAIVRERMA